MLTEKGALSDTQEEMIDHFHKGLGLYHEREWGKALTYFLQAQSIDENDGPSRYYIRDCRLKMESPPPADWDGVVTLDTK